MVLVLSGSFSPTTSPLLPSPLVVTIVSYPACVLFSCGYSSLVPFATNSVPLLSACVACMLTPSPTSQTGLCTHARPAEVEGSFHHCDWLEMGRCLQMGQSEPTCGFAGINGKVVLSWQDVCLGLPGAMSPPRGKAQVSLKLTQKRGVLRERVAQSPGGIIGVTGST